MNIPLVIDLSHHNPDPIDFTAIYGSGIIGAFLKASQGAGFTDPLFAARRTSAAAAGLLVGAYHFLTDAPVADQVAHFLAVAAPDGQTALAVDWEKNPAGASASYAQALDFVQQIEAATGQQVWVYCGGWAAGVLAGQDNSPLGDRPLWYAAYVNHAPDIPDPWDSATLWQYTDRAAVPGVAGLYDASTGNEAAIRAAWAAPLPAAA